MDELVTELPTGVSSSKIIVVEVQGPHVPSIDLVDNPGITTVPEDKAEAIHRKSA